MNHFLENIELNQIGYRIPLALSCCRGRTEQEPNVFASTVCTMYIYVYLALVICILSVNNKHCHCHFDSGLLLKRKCIVHVHFV